MFEQVRPAGSDVSETVGAFVTLLEALTRREKALPGVAVREAYCSESDKLGGGGFDPPPVFPPPGAPPILPPPHKKVRRREIKAKPNSALEEKPSDDESYW